MPQYLRFKGSRSKGRNKGHQHADFRLLGTAASCLQGAFLHSDAFPVLVVLSDQLIKSKDICIPNYSKTSMKLLHMGLKVQRQAAKTY